MKLVMFDDFIPGALRGDGVVDLRPVLGELADLPWDERMPALIPNYDALPLRLNQQARGCFRLHLLCGRFGSRARHRRTKQPDGKGVRHVRADGPLRHDRR